MWTAERCYCRLERSEVGWEELMEGSILKVLPAEWFLMKDLNFVVPSWIYWKHVKKWEVKAFFSNQNRMERNLLKTLPEFFKNRKQRTLFQWHNWGGGWGGGVASGASAPPWKNCSPLLPFSKNVFFIWDPFVTKAMFWHQEFKTIRQKDKKFQGFWSNNIRLRFWIKHTSVLHHLLSSKVFFLLIYFTAFRKRHRFVEVLLFC